MSFHTVSGKTGSYAVAVARSADGAIAAHPVEGMLPPRSRGDRLISRTRPAALQYWQRDGIEPQAASAPHRGRRAYANQQSLSRTKMRPQNISAALRDHDKHALRPAFCRSFLTKPNLYRPLLAASPTAHIGTGRPPCRPSQPLPTRRGSSSITCARPRVRPTGFRTQRRTGPGHVRRRVRTEARGRALC